MMCRTCIFRLWGSNKCLHVDSKYYDKVCMVIKNECKQYKEIK